MERDIEQLNIALHSLQILRSNVGQVFETVSNGLRADHGEEGKENKFVLELQDLLTNVNNNLRCVACFVTLEAIIIDVMFQGRRERCGEPDGTSGPFYISKYHIPKPGDYARTSVVVRATRQQLQVD